MLLGVHKLSHPGDSWQADADRKGVLYAGPELSYGNLIISAEIARDKQKLSPPPSSQLIVPH